MHSVKLPKQAKTANAGLLWLLILSAIVAADLTLPLLPTIY